MSFEAAAWAIKQVTETQTDKLVLIALCDCFNKNNSRCDPSNTHLSKIALCSERYISESVSRLQNTGFITVIRRSGRRNNYLINTPELSSEVQPLTPDVSSEVQPLTPELSSETPELSSPKPVRTSSNKNITSVCVQKHSCPGEVDPAIWTEFLAMRKKLKAVNSERAITALSNKIERFHNEGHDVNELIENSLVSAWKDIYPPRMEKNHGNSQRNNGPTATHLATNMEW